MFKISGFLASGGPIPGFFRKKAFFFGTLRKKPCICKKMCLR